MNSLLFWKSSPLTSLHTNDAEWLCAHVETLILRIHVLTETFTERAAKSCITSMFTFICVSSRRFFGHIDTWKTWMRRTFINLINKMPDINRYIHKVQNNLQQKTFCTKFGSCECVSWVSRVFNILCMLLRMLWICNTTFQANNFSISLFLKVQTVFHCRDQTCSKSTTILKSRCNTEEGKVDVTALIGSSAGAPQCVSAPPVYEKLLRAGLGSSLSTGLW